MTITLVELGWLLGLFAGWFVDWCLTAFSAQISTSCHGSFSSLGQGDTTKCNTNKKYNTLFNLVFVEIIFSTQ